MRRCHRGSWQGAAFDRCGKGVGAELTPSSGPRCNEESSQLATPIQIRWNRSARDRYAFSNPISCAMVPVDPISRCAAATGREDRIQAFLGSRTNGAPGPGGRVSGREA